jgi:hypothetical protein
VSDDEKTLELAQVEKREMRALQFMLSLLDRVVSDNEYTSSLVSGTAVLGVSAEWVEESVSKHIHGSCYYEHVAYSGAVQCKVHA